MSQLLTLDSEKDLKEVMLGGMFLGFIGETGAGKTTSITWFMYWLNKVAVKSPAIRIYTNYHLIDNEKEGLIWDYEFMHHPDELLELPEFSIAGIDDMWRWAMDSYKTGSNCMKKYDELQACGRKRGLMILASNQRYMRADPNFRANIHYIIAPIMYLDANYKPYRIFLTIINNHSGVREDAFPIDPRPVFEMFHTREEIKPFDKQERFDIEELAKEFIKWNNIEMEDANGNMVQIQQKLSTASIDLFLHKKGLLEYMGKSDRSIVKAQIERMMR